MSQLILSAEERHQLLTVLRELDAAAPPEKRKSPRKPVALRLRIRVLSSARRTTSQWATLRDVARNGIGLLLPNSLPIGTRLIAPLKFREGGGWLVLCEVRNCTDWKKGQFAVGARFIDRIDDPHGSGKPPMDWLL